MTDIKLATASLKSAKMRAALTMVAIVIGVAGFVLVTSFIDGLKSSVVGQIESFGGNLITVNSGKLTTTDAEGNVTGFDPLAAFGGAPTLTEKDLKDVAKLEGVKAAAPQMMVSLSGSVKRFDTEFNKVLILATNEDYPDALGQKLEIGRFFEDADSNNKVVLLGSKLAEEMFSGGFGLGAQVEIRKVRFTVIGVMEELENTALSFGADLNRIAIIPLAMGKQFNAGAANIAEIDIQVEEEVSADVVAESVEQLLLNNHGGEHDFTVLKQDEIIALSSSLLNQIKSVSQILAYVMLFVGGIVIALIMLITVKERTREIGIRKSIGATRGNILTQFLVEAVVISWIGSLVGVVVAWLIGFYISSAGNLSPAYTLDTLVSVVVIATAIGAISGIIPAAIAARKDPVVALRSE